MGLDAVVEGGLVEIEPDGGVGWTTADPFGGGVACATEIFAEGDGLSPTDLLEGLVDEVDLGFDILDGELVELVDIGIRRRPVA